MENLEQRTEEVAVNEECDANISGVKKSIKSRILEKIREDMKRGDEPAMLAFDSGGGHSRYSSGTP